jgi:NADH-quinone oxidoreductase subunit H
VLFILSPILIIAIGLLVWAFIPLSNLNYLVSLDFSLLVIYSVLSFGVYGIIMAGWSSNSRYAFIGSMRSASQLISYEISMSLTKIRLVCIDALECIGAQLCENNTKKFLLAYIVFAPTPEFD